MPSMSTNVVPAFRQAARGLIGSGTSLSQRYFVSPEIFAQEQNKIFSEQWLLVGHQSQIGTSGDYFLAEVAGENLIIVRDRKSTIRAFYNVCRHRGCRLREDRSGHTSAIQCPYHAWTYALDGTLLSAPHMDDVPGFDKMEHSLRPAHLGLWEGFIFVNLADSPTPLKEWFGPLTGKFFQWNLPKLRSAKRINYDVQANWKLLFENYSECYHCPGVHPQLSKVSPYNSAENDLIEGPFLGGFMRITNGTSLTNSGKSCALSVGTFGKDDFRRVFYYSIFPNALLSLHPDYVMVHQLWPVSPARTLIFCDWFFHLDAFEQKDFKPEDAIEFWDMTNKQDWHICELSHQGIASRAYVPGPFSSRESIPAAWDRYYLRVLSE